MTPSSEQWEKIEKEFDDIHSNLRVLCHAELGFPHKGETAGTMFERVSPHIKSFFRTHWHNREDWVRKAVEEMNQQNTYEGDEELVYRTTIKEVLAILDAKRTPCNNCDSVNKNGGKFMLENGTCPECGDNNTKK